MFKLKYNALSLVQIFFGFFNSVLLLKIFGVSGQTDAYFIGEIVVGSAVMIQMMAVEQFMYFYHELKARDRERANALFAYALFLTLAAGAAALAALNIFSGPVIRLFAYKLDPGRLEILERLFPVYTLLAVFNPLSFLNAKLLNAEGRFAYPYALSIIPSLASACALLYMYFTGGSDILWLLGASVAGGGAAALLGLAAVSACGVPVRLSASHPDSRVFVLDSVRIKFGHNINTLLAPMITNNVLSAFSPGAVSYFGYAWKIVTVIGNLMTGPSARIFASSVSAAWPLRQAGRIGELSREFLRLITPLFSVSVLAAYAALPYALGLLSSARLGAQDIAAIRLMFLALAAWYFIGLVESVYVQICIAGKRSGVFIFNNSIFVAAYFLLALGAKDSLGIYAIPFGLGAAQLASLALYVRGSAGALSSLSGGK